MRIVYFTHSLRSCWNHGNAHFLRGIATDLVARGHEVRLYESAGSWSLRNLLADHGPDGLAAFRHAYPSLVPLTYESDADVAKLCDGADLVIVHEWNDPQLVAAAGRARQGGGKFLLLFHDTHHRAVSDPEAIHAFDLTRYDGVLAFGEALAEVYRLWGWQDRVWVWHEAADLNLFHPPVIEQTRRGIVWIGNWGDGERTEELDRFLFEPAQACGLALDIYGVRYPADALAILHRRGATYRGWLPNAQAPEIFAQHLVTVHVPRRFYVERLPGIPTIRVFEALACGIPLVSAPWHDSEGLFNPGEDFLVARDGTEMREQLRDLDRDADLRASLVAHGLAAIRGRHSCAHRIDELMRIAHRLNPALDAPRPATESR